MVPIFTVTKRDIIEVELGSVNREIQDGSVDSKSGGEG